MSKLKCPYCGCETALDTVLKAYVPVTFDEFGGICLEKYSEYRDDMIEDSLTSCVNDENFNVYCNHCHKMSKPSAMSFNVMTHRMQIEGLEKIEEKGESDG